MIVGDVAISVGESAVYGIDLATGDQAWTIPRGGGPLSMPAVGTVGGERVLVFLDRAGSDQMSLVGVDLSTRKERWRTDLEVTARSGVTIDGGTAYAADQDGNVYAVDLDDGSVRWTAKTIGRVEGPVAVDGGSAYVVARNPDARSVELDAFDTTTGKKTWSFAPRLGAATASVPAAGDGLVVAGAADQLFHGLAESDGTERWTSLALTLFSPVSGVALQPGAVYAADASGGVYRVNPANGDRVWDHQLNDLVVRSSPVVVGSAVLIGLNDGRLVALDAASGDLVWQGETGQGLIGAIALSPTRVVAVKGGTHAGLVAFEHDPTGHLVDVPSPTKVDLGRLAGNFAVAFLASTLALFVPFWLLRRRFGLAGSTGEGAEEGEERDLALTEGAGEELSDDEDGQEP